MAKFLVQTSYSYMASSYVDADNLEDALRKGKALNELKGTHELDFIGRNDTYVFNEEGEELYIDC